MLLRRFIFFNVNWKESICQEDLDTQYYTTYDEKWPISTNPSTVQIPIGSHIILNHSHLNYWDVSRENTWTDIEIMRKNLKNKNKR